MSKRQVAYCSTCEKFLPKPELRVSCEAEGHTVTTEQQKLQSSNGVRKRCKHTRAKWNDCRCPWYYSARIKGTPHRGVLGRFEHRIAAEKAFGEVKDRIFNGLPAFEPAPAAGEPQPEAETLKSYATTWLTRIPHRARCTSTATTWKTTLCRCSATPLTTLTRQQCHAFTLSLLDKKLAHSSRVGILTTLSAVLTAAVDDPRCPLQLHPAIGLRKHLKQDSTKLKSKRLPKDKYFEREEVTQLLATAQEHFPKWYLFVFCGLRTGLRLGELLALQWGDIDWRKGSFTCSGPG